MDRTTGRVLIAQSDPQISAAVRAQLANAGFSVDVCADGEAAYRFILTQQPDAAILDDNLPGMSGLEIIQRLSAHESGSDGSAILLTGSGAHADAVAALDAGARDYVYEPIDVAELIARVRTVLRRRVIQRKVSAENTLLSDELMRQTQRLELLYELGRDLSQAGDEEQIYDSALAAVSKATGSQRISLLRYDAHTQQLVCKRAMGIDPRIAEQLSIDPASGIAGQVFTTGDTVVACALNNDLPPDRIYASDTFLSTPLVSTYLNSREQRLGVLNVTDKPDGSAFTTEEIEMLSSIAASTAIALHNSDHEATLKRAIRALLLTVGRLSEYRDEDTGLHVERVRDYARVVARQLALNPKFTDDVTPAFIEDLSQAAPLHDVGKVAIPDEILNKPGKLTREEFQIMKTHTTIGRHTLNLAMEETGPIPLLRMCIDIAYCHHERWDGKGYPRGLAGTNIPLAARIVGLVDAYDAITSQRCYKPARPHDEAVDIIRSESAKHFDPDVVEAFLEVADNFNHIRSAKADDVLAALQAAGARSA